MEIYSPWRDLATSRYFTYMLIRTDYPGRTYGWSSRLQRSNVITACPPDGRDGLVERPRALGAPNTGHQLGFDVDLTRPGGCAGPPTGVRPTGRRTGPGPYLVSDLRLLPGARAGGNSLSPGAGTLDELRKRNVCYLHETDRRIQGPKSRGALNFIPFHTFLPRRDGEGRFKPARGYDYLWQTRKTG